MQNHKLIPLFILGGLTVTAQAQTIYYSQTFNASSSQELDLYNWSAHHGNTAIAYPLDSTESGENPWVSAAASGAGDNSGNGTATGYLYHFGSLNPNDRTMWWTNDFTPFAVSTLDSFQVDLRNSDTSESVQFAFQVDNGTAWFRLNDAFNSSVAGQWSNNLTLNVASASGISILNFDPGTDFSSGATTTMPTTGNVTAVGIYNFDIDGDVRIDNFEVYVIPEPSSYALIAGSLGLLGVTLRRRFRNR